MANTLTISKFSSLNFRHKINSFEIPEHYFQHFSLTDSITLQWSVPNGIVIKSDLLNICTNLYTSITPALIYSDEEYDFYQLVITSLQEGSYKLILDQDGINTLQPLETAFFKITDDEVYLLDTVLLTYTNYENDKDAVFVNEDGSKNVFQFRVEGGFKSGEMEDNIDNEDFRTQRYEEVQLSAFPYKVKTFTIGDNDGVPNWVATKINLIFSLSDVMIDGVYHTRSGSSVPEANELLLNKPQFVYKMNVEESYIDYGFSYDLYLNEWILEHGVWNMKGIWKNDGIWKYNLQ